MTVPWIHEVACSQPMGSGTFQIAGSPRSVRCVVAPQVRVGQGDLTCDLQLRIPHLVTAGLVLYHTPNSHQGF